MLYGVRWRRKWRKESELVTGLKTFGEAQRLGEEKMAASKVVVILEAAEEIDVVARRCHPDNVGRYFLCRILK